MPAPPTRKRGERAFAVILTLAAVAVRVYTRVGMRSREGAMVTLSGVLGGVLGKYFIEQTFGDGLTRDMSLGVFGWAQKALGREKARTLDKHCNDLTDAVLADVEDALIRDGASRDQLRRMGQGLAVVLEAAEPSRLVTDHAYDAEAVTAALVAATPEGLLDPDERGLYESMAAMIAGMLVKVGPALMDYEARSEEAKFRALAALAKDTGALRGDVAAIRETLEAVERSIGDAADEDTRRRNLFIEEYRAAIRRELDYVEILGLDRVDREQGTAKLSVAYLSLTGRTGGEEVDFESLLAALVVRGNRVVIEGGAGSGKSTLLRWAASEGPRWIANPGVLWTTPGYEESHPIMVVELSSFVQKRVPIVEINIDGRGPRKSLPTTLPDERGTEITTLAALKYECSERKRLASRTWDFPVISITPYLIRLRSLENANLPDLENLPNQTCPALTGPPPHFVADTLRDGHAILMFDGVDEVPEGARRDNILREIGQYAKAYPKCPIIIATRPDAFDPGAVDGLQDFERYIIDDLSPEQQALFIDRWHEARADAAGPESRTDFTEIAEQLKERFRLSPQLSRMASSPLLCAAVCALHERQPETLPENERDLVEALTLMLLRRDIVGGRTRAIDIDSHGPEYALGDDKRLALLGHLAAKMVRAGLSQLDMSSALQAMPKALTEIAEPGLDPEKMVQALVARSGVLRPCSRAEGGGLDAVEFIHNRFKEWLASVHFIGEDASDELARNADREDYAEVAVFAAAAPGNKAFAERLINALLDRAEAQEGDAQRTFEILAFRASMAATALSEELRGRIDALQKRLVPPKTITEAKALAQAGDDIAPRLTYRKGRGAAASVACIRCLGLIGTPKAKAAMESWLVDTRLGVIRELLRHRAPHKVPNLWRGKDGVLKFDGDVGKRLSRLPETFPEALSELDLSDSAIRDIATIGAAPGLNDVSLKDSEVEDLAPLAELPGLESLDVSGLTEEVLTTLPAMPSLRVLWMGRILDGPWVDFSGFPGLQGLSLHHTKFEDAGALVGLADLEFLNFAYSSVRDIAPLGRLRKLRSLDLSKCDVSDISALGSLSRLEVFNLYAMPVTDLSSLGSIVSLRELILVDLPAQPLDSLGGLSALEKLQIDHTPVDGFDWLAGLESLSELSARGVGMTAADLRALPPSVRRLHIGHNPIDDLSTLREHRDLRMLSIERTAVRDLSPLVGLDGLGVLTCNDKAAYPDTPPDVFEWIDAQVGFVDWR